MRRGLAPGFVNYKIGYTRLAAASDKIYQLPAHCRWFSSGTPASSTTKYGRHDIAEILLKIKDKCVLLCHLATKICASLSEAQYKHQRQNKYKDETK
jgi:hypothetical protein